MVSTIYKQLHCRNNCLMNRRNYGICLHIIDTVKKLLTDTEIIYYLWKLIKDNHWMFCHWNFHFTSQDIFNSALDTQSLSQPFLVISVHLKKRTCFFCSINTCHFFIAQKLPLEIISMKRWKLFLDTLVLDMI